MTDIIQREASSCTLTQLTSKLIPEVIGREIEKATQGIYPLQNVSDPEDGRGITVDTDNNRSTSARLSC